MEPDLFELRREFELLSLNQPLPEQTPSQEDYLLHTLHKTLYTLDTNTEQLNSILYLSRQMTLYTYRFAQKNQPNRLWVPIDMPQSFSPGCSWMQHNSYVLTRLHQNLLMKVLHPDLHESRFFLALEIEELMLGEYEELKQSFYEGNLLQNNNYSLILPFLRTDMILNARRCEEDHIRWEQRFSLLENVKRTTSAPKGAEHKVVLSLRFSGNQTNQTNTYGPNIFNTYTSVDINSQEYIQQQIR